MPHETPSDMGNYDAFPDPDHPVWEMVDQFPPTPLGEQAWAAYQQDLPRLVETARGQWAAYHGEERLGVNASNRELCEECLRRGFAIEECVICRIEPIIGHEITGLGGSRIEYAE